MWRRSIEIGILFHSSLERNSLGDLRVELLSRFYNEFMEKVK
jgi:hypothetical protein